MALDARHRSSIFGKLVPLLGEEDANVLMSEFPSVEANELVTKDFLRGELAITRGELRSELADLREELRNEMAGLRVDIANLRNELTLRMVAVVATATALLGTLITVN